VLLLESGGSLKGEFESSLKNKDSRFGSWVERGAQYLELKESFALF
jgi:hypothetical protein